MPFTSRTVVPLNLYSGKQVQSPLLTLLDVKIQSETKRKVTSPAQINLLSVSPQEMDMESPMFSTFKFKRPRKSHCSYSQTWEKSLLEVSPAAKGHVVCSPPRKVGGLETN